MSFLTALGSIVEAVKLLGELLKFLKTVFGDNPQKFLKDASEVFSELKLAKTPEDKINAAKKIQDLVSRL